MNQAGSIIARFRTEFFIAVRFGLVGLVATFTHILLVWYLIWTTAIPALMSNFIAFMIAFGISFTGNYFWTFGGSGNIRRSARRFILISITAFLFNSAVLAVLVATKWLPTTMAAMISAAVVPPFSYVASRLWGFKSISIHKELQTCSTTSETLNPVHEEIH